jgi:hypothetical protein
LAFAGLEKDDYHLFAVQHDEPNGSKHIHILVPRVHLGTKKSLNIAPPNHSSVFYPWRDFWNESKGWASPKDPARRRRLGKTRDGFLLDKQKQKKGLKLEKDEREFIVDSIEQGIRAGKIKNRADVENFLKNEFLTEGVGVVSRVVKNSISVRLYEDGEDSKLGKAMRLTGAFFDAGFDAENWLAVEQEKNNKKGQPSQRPKKTPDEKVVQELELRVDEILRLRAERQSKYYAYEREDIKDEDKLDLSTLIKKGQAMTSQIADELQTLAHLEHELKINTEILNTLQKSKTSYMQKLESLQIEFNSLKLQSVSQAGKLQTLHQELQTLKAQYKNKTIELEMLERDLLS